ncbi:MAG: oligosaccharide flippase family protein [Elusimicrobia bacterium]|nr:oligosaccharide flippase family protein [Elusimicrobiota bacterium]
MIGVRQVLKGSSLISAVNVLGGFVAFFANFAIARKVGPQVLGAVGLVNLWLLYAGLLRPGFVAAGFRDVLHLTGAGQEAKALHVQNVAFTYEGSLLIVSVLALMSGSLFYQEPLLKVGMLLAGGTFFFQSLVRYQETIQWTKHRFGLIAQGGLVNRLLGPGLSLLGAYKLGGLGLLMAPIGTAAATNVFYRLAAPPAGFTFTWDWTQAKKLLHSGLPLTLIAVLYWGFRTSDRSMVAAWFPLEAMGYFVFAMGFIDMGLQLCSDFYNVLQVQLLSELGKTGSLRPLAPLLTRLAVLTAALTCIGANLAQAGFAPIIGRFLPKFQPSVVPFDVLAFNLVCLSAPILPSTVLTSALLNRQKMCCVIQVLGLVVNVAGCALMTSWGWGLEGVAVSSVISQIFVSILHYRLLHGALFAGAAPREKIRFYSWFASLPVASLAVYLVLQHGSPALLATREDWLGPLCLRVAIVSAAWSAILFQVYRSWWADSTALGDVWTTLKAKAGVRASPAGGS